MSAEDVSFLEANIDETVEFEMLDGTRFLGVPLFVYTGEESPDVFLLPVQRERDGTLKRSEAGQSILLEDILVVRHVAAAFGKNL